MLRIMLQKLFSKKWMNMCLLLGSILLIATVVSFPLYQTAAYDRLLQDEFNNYVSENGSWPAINSYLSISKNDYNGETLGKMEKLLNSMNSDLGVTTRENISYYVQGAKPGKSEWGREDLQNLNVMVGFLSNLDKHARMVTGEMYSELGRTDDGAIEVVVSEAGLVGMKLMVGETIIVEGLRDTDGKNIRIFIKGVFDADDYSDFYWQVKPDEMSSIALMNENIFREIFLGENIAKYSITCRFYSMFEYEDIKASDVDNLIKKTNYLTEEGPYRQVVDTPPYKALLEEYGRKQDRIRATLLILQIPVLVMLMAFLFMISGQMYEMEKNEISVIKSRGSSGAQIFRLYLYQSIFLTVVGAACGIPLGGVFARVLGSSRDFLEFTSGRNLTLTYNAETWKYAIAAVIVTLLIMTLPAIKHSKVTIVKLKQSKAVRATSWWEKFFLDIIILAVSLYGYYSFNKNASVAENVLSGESLDPLLYMSSSLFIVGAGLLFLRLQPYIIKLIYLCGKKHWKPASYTSFMENIKNGRKQQFIMLFLIMTISLGMFHATVARTIVKNAEANVNYLDSADIIIKESWVELKDSNGNPTGNYSEPDYTKYAKIEAVDKFTKVIYDTKAHISAQKLGHVNVTVEAIHTKQFGEITWLEKKYNGEHYYNILNSIAEDQKNVVLTENFHSKLGYEVGDSITYYANGNNEVNGVIVGFVNYWPGYSPTVTMLNPDGTVETSDNYLIISNYDHVVQKVGQCPYEIWMNLKDGYSSNDKEIYIDSLKPGIRSIQSFYTSLYALRDELELIEVEKNHFVRFDFFIANYCTCNKDELFSIGRRIADYSKEDIFTVKMTDIDNYINPYAEVINNPFFIYSLLRTINGIKSCILGNQCIIVTRNGKEPSLAELLLDILKKNGPSKINYLVDKVISLCEIKMDRSKIICSLKQLEQVKIDEYLDIAFIEAESSSSEELAFFWRNTPYEDIVLNQRKNILNSNDLIVDKFWKDKYDSFVNGCQEKQKIYMRELVDINIEKLCDDFSIPRHMIVDIIDCFISWVKELNSKSNDNDELITLLA